MASKHKMIHKDVYELIEDMSDNRLFKAAKQYSHIKKHFHTLSNNEYTKQFNKLFHLIDPDNKVQYCPDMVEVLNIGECIVEELLERLEKKEDKKKKNLKKKKEKKSVAEEKKHPNGVVEHATERVR